MSEGSRVRVAHRRARWFVRATLCLAVACAAVSACGTSKSSQHPGGDPDGRLLAALSPVDAALPPGAQIDYVHKTEPLWEACDGVAGTSGWSDVAVDAAFTSSRNVREIVAYADKVLTHQGWTRELLGQPDGHAGVSSTWTKSIPPAVDVVRLSLSNNALLGGQHVGWALHTSATPPGHPVRGC